MAQSLRVRLEDNNVALVVLVDRDSFIPVVGINHTTGGWFLNYYINKEHPWFGTEAHDSRHPRLIAARLTKDHDVYSVSDGVVPIDERENPEELPARSITPDLMLPWMHRRLLDPVRHVMNVPAKMCLHGVLVKVVIYPRSLQPTGKEMVQIFNEAGGDKPVRVFTPAHLPNPVAVAVFSCDHLQQILPFPIDGPNSFKPSLDGKGMVSKAAILLGTSAEGARTERVPKRKRRQ